MKKFRLIIICVSLILILLTLFFIDYQNFISRANFGAFLGIFAMILNIISMILSDRHEAKIEKMRKP
jgi:hypothetical protein